MIRLQRQLDCLQERLVRDPDDTAMNEKLMEQEADLAEKRQKRLSLNKVMKHLQTLR